jgi:hypothetical protein
MAEMINADKGLLRKPEAKRPLERDKCRQEDNLRMDLRETGWEVVDCIQLAQDTD